MSEMLFGRNAARECLRARRRHIHKLILARGIKPGPVVQEILSLAHRLKVPVEELPRQRLETLSKSTSHQGVLLEVGRLPTLDVADLLKPSARGEEPPFILALDHIEDPHNVGALLRSAESVGVHGVIIPNRRAAGITPTVVNASAGATEHQQIVIVSNLAQALQKLQKENVWVVGVEKSSASQPYHKVDLNMPLALVIGSEGKGLSQRIGKLCDLLIEFPMRGNVESLNASVAGALALYEAWRARQFYA